MSNISLGRAILAVSASLCVASTATAQSASPQASTAPAASVHIKDFKFMPQRLTVRPGETVTFVNDDDETHTATADDGSFDSKALATKASFAHAFPATGTYPYHCKIHTSMQGTIVVQSASGGKEQ